MQEIRQLDYLKTIDQLAGARPVIDDRGRQQLFETVHASRRNDLLVYLASANLRRRIPLQDLPDGIREDIKTFFGTYKQGLEAGFSLLRSAADPSTVTLACDDTNDGWQDERALYVSTALIDRLPTVLRIYVACAELLFGEAKQADLVKIHKFSGKATFLSYRHFERSCVPTLLTRSKVDLRAGRVDVFDHSGQDQLLFFKERFLPPDHVQRPLLLELGQALREVGVSDTTFIGPSAIAVRALLTDCGRADVVGQIFAPSRGTEEP